MSDEDNRVRSVLRAMAWERAKGELFAMTRTFYELEKEQYASFKKEVTDFIEKVEGEGLDE